MRKTIYSLSALVFLVCFLGCTKVPLQKETASLEKAKASLSVAARGSVASPTATGENFDNGTKTAYAAADVTLISGIWNLNDALLGNSTSDRKNGTQSARVRNSGKLTMKFDVPSGAAAVTILHAKYGTDANGSWQLWYSTNGGTSYTQSGTTVTTSSTTLQPAVFTVNVSGAVRFEIRKTDAGTNRICFDDVLIDDYTASGNPAPSLGAISPASASAGAAAFTLTVNGNNFISSSVINWNGAALATTFVNAAQLSATVPAANIAAAGTASVTVFTPAPGGGTSTAAAFTISAVSTAKKFLFDASQGETAGNADWVIDEDNSTPQRIPTPAQSTITSGTAETYWTGGISAWGISLAKLGHSVETLPSSGSITYGNTNNTQDLSKYDVFVVDEPNIRFTAAEKVAIINFVSNGGGLCIVGNHNGSDRNSDGWDAPAIWNDLMNNNTVQNNPFGFSFDAVVNFSQLSSNILTNSSSNVILNGSQGAVSQLEFNNGASASISTTANPNVKGLIWRSSVTQNSSNIMCGSSTYGNGRVFFVGDSSPPDDGTGAPNNTLFNGWGVYSHKKLFMNASLWLAKLQ
jgi:hypothetical protein